MENQIHSTSTDPINVRTISVLICTDFHFFQSDIVKMSFEVQKFSRVEEVDTSQANRLKYISLKNNITIICLRIL